MFKYSISFAVAILLAFGSLSHATIVLNGTFTHPDGTDVTTLPNWSGAGSLINSGQLTAQGGQNDYAFNTGSIPAVPNVATTLSISMDFPNTMGGAANSWFGIVGSGLGDGRFVAVEDASGSGGGNVFYRIWTDGTATGVDSGIALSALTHGEIQAVSDGMNFTSARVILNNGAHDSGPVSVTANNAIADMSGVRVSGNPGPLTIDNIMIDDGLIPEPSSVLLLGLGTAFMGLVRFRRRR